MLDRHKLEDSNEATSSDVDILQSIRYALVMKFAGAIGFFAAMAALSYWLNDSTEMFPIGAGLLIVWAIHLYAGRYVPISNKHDSLVSKFGARYLEEVDSAVKDHGIGKLVQTHWFETYAEEFCSRSGIS